jgi:hypothetical protein
MVSIRSRSRQEGLDLQLASLFVEVMPLFILELPCSYDLFFEAKLKVVYSYA